MTVVGCSSTSPAAGQRACVWQGESRQCWPGSKPTSAHLSFKPMADPKGKFKCQESAQVPVSDLFSEAQLATFATFVAEVGFEPGQHWRLSPCQTQADCLH